MDMTKLLPPQGVTSVSIEGQEFVLAEDGTIEVPAAHALNLYAQGFGNPPVVAADVVKARAGAKGKAAQAETPAGGDAPVVAADGQAQ